jgi:hypothetical protein
MIGWESFAEILSDGSFSIDNAGPLHSPIQSFKIYRDDNLQICLETVCEATASTNRPEHPPGTVTYNENFLEIVRSLGMARARANGVSPLTFLIKNGSILTEKSTISRILLTLREDAEGRYTLDWLTNIYDGFYLWPDLSELDVTETSEQVLKSGDVSIKATDKNTSRSVSRNCIFVIVGNCQLFLGTAQDAVIDSSFMPGYILYKGVPTEEERKKIRLSLSFAFGRPFVYMGHSIFTEDWKLISSQALSPYTIDGKVFKFPTLPPAPLSQQSRNEIGSQQFSDLANAFYHCFDAYDLEHVSWLYWHSVASPAYMAALSFGATFEAIQQAYIKSKGDAFETRLLEKTVWSSVSDKVKKVIRDNSITENSDTDSKKRIDIIINKIDNLNQTPQSELTKRFLDSLHIRLSEKEQNAWIQRNKAAHGSKTDADDYIKLIKDTKLLRVLCNRVLLAITGASSQYIDYYSINFPVKNLQEAVE